MEINWNWNKKNSKKKNKNKFEYIAAKNKNLCEAMFLLCYTCSI